MLRVSGGFLQPAGSREEGRGFSSPHALPHWLMTPGCVPTLRDRGRAPDLSSPSSCVKEKQLEPGQGREWFCSFGEPSVSYRYTFVFLKDF